MSRSDIFAFYAANKTDQTNIAGSYNSTFYISGISILTSGLLVIPIADYWTCSSGPRSDEEDPHQHHKDQETGPNADQQGDAKLLHHPSTIDARNRDNSNQLPVGRYNQANGKTTQLSEAPRSSPSPCRSPALSISPTRVRFCLTPSPPTTTTTSTTPLETMTARAATSSSAGAATPSNEDRPAT